MPGGQRPGTTSNCGKGRICEARVVEGGVKIIDIIATALTATTPVVTTRRDTRRVRRPLWPRCSRRWNHPQLSRGSSRYTGVRPLHRTALWKLRTRHFSKAQDRVVATALFVEELPPLRVLRATRVSQAVILCAHGRWHNAPQSEAPMRCQGLCAAVLADQ